MYSDILTPLNAMGIPFDIDESKGPLIMDPIRTVEETKRIHMIDVDAVSFVGESLQILRSEVKGLGVDTPAILGFVGSPWTLATYVVEGSSTSTYKVIKTLADKDPEALHAILQKIAESIAVYSCYQVRWFCEARAMATSSDLRCYCR